MVPFYASTYIPEEVAKLPEFSNEPKKIDFFPMKTVTYTSPRPTQSQYEKPVMYGTIVESKATSVLHPNLKPNIIEGGPERSDFFSEPGAELITEGNPANGRIGSYSVGVNLGSLEAPSYVKASFVETAAETNWHHMHGMHHFDNRLISNTMAKYNRRHVHHRRLSHGLPTIQTSGLRPLPKNSEGDLEYFNDLPRAARKVGTYAKHPGHAYEHNHPRKAFIPS